MSSSDTYFVAATTVTPAPDLGPDPLVPLPDDTHLHRT